MPAGQTVPREAICEMEGDRLTIPNPIETAVLGPVSDKKAKIIGAALTCPLLLGRMIKGWKGMSGFTRRRRGALAANTCEGDLGRHGCGERRRELE